MRILKSHPLLSLANGYVVDSPQPSNLSYIWNFGILLAFFAVKITLLYNYEKNRLNSVITNLMSAIPWVGQDIVEFIWGGLFITTIGVLIFIFICICLNLFTLGKKSKWINLDLNTLRFLVVVYFTAFALRSPMFIFCKLLGLMYLYYVWCGLVACIVLYVISEQKSQPVSPWGFLVSFVYTVLLVYWNLVFLSFVLIPVLFLAIPSEQIFSALKLNIHEYLVCNINRTIPINPGDPSNQLLNGGYNFNGTNQPLARNIATCLADNYRNNKASGLSKVLLPLPVQRFMLDYLMQHDITSYVKVMGHNGELDVSKATWWNLSNSHQLREGLTNLN